jgi:hypothetical protein
MAVPSVGGIGLAEKKLPSQAYIKVSGRHRYLRYPRLCSYYRSYFASAEFVKLREFIGERIGWRMGGDSNPRCLSAHTLSRRAQ